MVKTLSGTNSSQMKKSPSFLFFFTIQNAGNFPAMWVYLYLAGQYAFSMEHLGAGFFGIKFGSIRGPIRVAQVAGGMDFFAG